MSAATMMPTPLGALPSKPKIGFSIDSIVGADVASPVHRRPAASEASDLSPASSPESASRRYPATDAARTSLHGRPRSASSASPSPPPPPHAVVRPAPHALPLGFHLGEATPTPTPTLHHGVHHQHQLALAAAAHFQAAGLAAALGHGGPGFGPGQQHPMGQHHHAQPRDSYPLYPWLLSRHGRIFPHRFPQGPDIPGFLLQPFRKPKRIRTAFSPSQLLKLEHAFEKNHYVVGAERKQLAQALSLTETQVKVWFQNRRTKHKRMQQEEEAKAAQSAHAQSGGAAGKNSHHASKWKQETQPSGGGGRDAAETPEDAELDVEDSCSSASGEET